MLTGKFIQGDGDLSEILAIRKKVFIEEQHGDQTMLFDSLDQEANHVIVRVDEKPVAVGRVVLQQDFNCKIGRIAVLKEERGKQYGDFVVRLLLDRAFRGPAVKVYVTAQVHAVPFYERFGFHRIGAEYLSEGILSVDMELEKRIYQPCQCKG